MQYNLLKFYKLFFNQDVYGLHQKALAAQWVSKDELNDIQVRKLKSLLVHAGRNVPYYRALFKEGWINPDECNDLTFLEKIPLLTKDAIQTNQDALISINSNRKKLLKCRTGGSTGKGLVFYVDDFKRASVVAFRLRGDSWTGVSPFSRSAMLWAVEKSPGFFSALWKQTKEVASNQHVYDLWQLSQENVKQYVDGINRLKPELIVGYSTGLYMLSMLMEKENLKIFGQPKIISTAEMLTDQMADQIGRNISPLIFNRYGCREVGPLAMTCEAGGWHINSDNVIFEVTDSLGNPLNYGIKGDVVVTDLNNFSMPFIRYSIEDMASLSSKTCRCGRGFPLISGMDGRSGEILMAGNGKLVHMSRIVLYMEKFNSISLYQIHQAKDKNILLKLKLRQGVKNTDVIEKSIVTGLEDIMGHGISIKVKSNEAFVKTGQGKHRYIVSDFNLVSGLV
ncbi:MAG: hypothetical protein U9N77_07045 [Thermodesulfobacteriota bacterium]|nr:hypothetical protein [Thermodesulfobacteriota bacterium]